MSDFIDRAKLDAEAWKYANENDSTDSGSLMSIEAAFLAGAAAYAALLDAETTEEWGLAPPEDSPHPVNGGLDEVQARSQGKRYGYMGHFAVHRYVLYGPWLPSEGGEKP